MSDQDQTNQTPYHRQTPHISQEPIDDIPTEYVMPNRYTTVDQASARHGRRDMGVASNDPDYLPRTPDPARNGAAVKVKQPKTHASAFNYDHYLQTPKSGKSIFSSRQRRRQKRLRQVVAVAVVAAVVVLVIVLFVL